MIGATRLGRTCRHMIRRSEAPSARPPASAGPQVIAMPDATREADGVGTAAANVQQAQNQLEALLNQMGSIDEQYGAASDRKGQLDADIAVAQFLINEAPAAEGGAAPAATAPPPRRASLGRTLVTAAASLVALAAAAGATWWTTRPKIGRAHV